MTNQHSATAVLWVHALTPLHPGSGTALGVVDLPVQRERHTRWPTIPGSSLKGVLRDAFQRNGNGNLVTTIFGPATQDAAKHAGAVSITDARLFAFPVRSLQGVFAWVTSPGVLQRLSRDLELIGNHASLSLPSELAGLPENAAWVHSQSLLPTGNQVVLEEFIFQVTKKADELIEQLASLPRCSSLDPQMLQQRLVIVHDNQLTHFVRFCTEVTARIGLDYETKTVNQGALFYQEFLPSETIFYSLIVASSSRNKEQALSAKEILNHLINANIQMLQIGGDETIGKGLCALGIKA